MVPLLWKRELGVRRTGIYEAALCQHQRFADQRIRTQVPLSEVGTARRDVRGGAARTAPNPLAASSRRRLQRQSHPNRPLPMNTATLELAQPCQLDDQILMTKPSN